MGFLKDFKAFALKGNVIDMAVGVVIGGAFGKIVTSIVNDVIMPLVSVMTGGVNFTDWKWVLSPEVVDEVTQEVAKAEVALTYGNLIQNVVDFLLIALSIFVVIRVATKAGEKLRKKEEEAPAVEEPKGPTQEELLTEIRDLLKASK
ncbi:MAG: large-conductance mechanosensitive channel protein MscL [Clostridia bacterium]|nr:large-conductance mechanosensitive channel protein MscL [Clostridia bacterium]